MPLTQCGPVCDVCDGYILLDKSINPFTIGGQNCTAHDKCAELLKSLSPLNKDNFETLPEGRLKKALADIFKKDTPNE